MSTHVAHHNSSDLPFSIDEFHQGLEAGRWTVESLVFSYIANVQKNPLGAYLHVCRETALESARHADREWKAQGRKILEKQPLHGVPFAAKDILASYGVPTTCGSRILENYIPPYHATALERLEKAGAILLGKTNLDEFAMGSSTENSAFFPTEHPSHPGRVPGGSSGGSAVAVASHQALVALGTDTGGSIRLPAHFCGLVGLKPSYGRVSRWGQIAYGSSLDQMGPLARCVTDAAFFLDILSGHDTKDPSCASLPATQIKAQLEPFLSQSPSGWAKGIKIGVPQEFCGEGLQAEVRQVLELVQEKLREEGATFKILSLPHLPYSIAVYYLVAVSEAASNLARYDGVRFGRRLPFSIPKDSLEKEIDLLMHFYEKNRGLFGPEVKRRILLGTFALSSGYQEEYFLKACRVRRQIQNDFKKAFREVDLLLGPVSPSTAFLKGSKTQDPLAMYLEDIFTVPVNLAGLPALSLPSGKDGLGLPIGMQFIAPAFQEERLLKVAFGVERRLAL